MAIIRTDSNGAQQKKIKVPLSYAPRDKLLARLESDPEFKRPDAITLPRMGFAITGFNYAADRKLNTMNQFTKYDSVNANRKQTAYAPVPYDISFELYIMVKTSEDGTQLVEQILPMFTPEWTNTINLIDELGVDLDVPLILNGVSQEDTYEGNYEERRAITWTLSFTMKGYFFGPVKKKNQIKIANTSFNIRGFDTLDSSNSESRVVITPGLIPATGQGVISVSNTIVVGSNTAFSSEFELGSFLVIGNTDFYKIESISNSTYMTITPPIVSPVSNVQYGSTHTGTGTTDPSLTIPPQYINIDDNWSDIVEITFQG